MRPARRTAHQPQLVEENAGDSICRCSSPPPVDHKQLRGVTLTGAEMTGATSRRPPEARSTSTTETLAGEIEGATTGGDEK